MQARLEDPRSAKRISWLGLGAGAFLVQIVLIYGVGAAANGQWLRYALPLAHLLLLPFLLRNLAFWGVKLILLGLVLNLAAIVANGGLMPVEAPAVDALRPGLSKSLEFGEPIAHSKNQLLEREDIRLRKLTDRLELPLPKPFKRVVSVGDVSVFLGLVVIYGEILVGRGAGRRASATGTDVA